MKIVFLSTGHKIPSWLESLKTDYKNKISYWLPVEVEHLKPVSLGRDSSERKKLEESTKLFSYLEPSDFVIACDERGKELTSEKFASSLEQVLAGGKKRIVFVIGGAYGLTEDILARSDMKLSLSKFVLNHQLAMAVILEQTYRAFTILKGVRYHNA